MNVRSREKQVRETIRRYAHARSDYDDDASTAYLGKYCTRGEYETCPVPLFHGKGQPQAPKKSEDEPEVGALLPSRTIKMVFICVGPYGPRMAVPNKLMKT